MQFLVPGSSKNFTAKGAKDAKGNQYSISSGTIPGSYQASMKSILFLSALRDLCGGNWLGKVTNHSLIALYRPLSVQH
jgi:hypothetical protein